jgi:hypothetical protein
MRYPDHHNYDTLEDFEDAIEKYYDWIDYKMDEARDNYKESLMDD